MFVGPAPKEDAQIDECLDRIDVAMLRLQAKAARAKTKKHKSPINGFHPDRRRRACSAMRVLAETTIVSKNGDDILLKSTDGKKQIQRRLA